MNIFEHVNIFSNLPTIFWVNELSLNSQKNSNLWTFFEFVHFFDLMILFGNSWTILDSWRFFQIREQILNSFKFMSFFLFTNISKFSFFFKFLFLFEIMNIFENLFLNSWTFFNTGTISKIHERFCFHKKNWTFLGYWCSEQK